MWSDESWKSARQKVHAVAARSRFPSQNVESTTGSDHFWKLRWWKKCTLLWREAHFQVNMYKAQQARTTCGSWDDEKCTPLWREAHFQVKMCKTHQVRTTFKSSDVEKAHAVVARSTFRSQKVQKNDGYGTLLDVQISRGRRKGLRSLSKYEQNVTVL